MIEIMKIDFSKSLLIIGSFKEFLVDFYYIFPKNQFYSKMLNYASI